MQRQYITNEKKMVEFAEKNYDEASLQKFRKEKALRPNSYPALAIWNEDENFEFVELREFLEISWQVLEITDSGILIIKVPDFDQSTAELESMQQALKSLGLSALLMRKGDEVVELTHQQLVNIANSMGYEVKAKGQA